VLIRELANLEPHMRALDRLMRKYRFPIVHMNDSPLLPAARVARKHGARIVWHLRSALAGEGLDRRSRVITALMERWGDAAIAIDSDVASRFRIELPVTIVHNSMPMPAEIADAEKARRALDLPDDSVLIGFAGFIRRQKGWPELVEAADLLVAGGSRAHFVIMGGGVRPPSYFRTPRGRVLAAASLLSDEETAIKELVRRKGLDARFSFLPFTPQTGEVYSALDVVAFPNQGVGLGRPVLEAATYGKPVVASGSSDGGGLLIDGETGILLEDRSPPAIAAALERLIDDPALRARMGARAAAHARQQFDPRRNARAIERVYDELVGDGSEDDAASEAPRTTAAA
jgi:glycosyltransferase involved in cell wall biosynthesis